MIGCISDTSVSDIVSIENIEKVTRNKQRQDSKIYFANRCVQSPAFGLDSAFKFSYELVFLLHLKSGIKMRMARDFGALGTKVQRRPFWEPVSASAKKSRGD